MNGSSSPGAVVCGVDGSRWAEDAALWAAAEAVRRRAELHLLHAMPPPPVAVVGGPPGRWVAGSLRDRAERILTGTATRCREEHPGLTVRTRTDTAPAAQVLLRHGTEAGVLVVGSRGLGGHTGLVVGSVGVALAAAAPCPVVVVRASDGAPPTTGPVLLGLDPSACGADIGFAVTAALARRCPLVVVHAWYTELDGDPLTEFLDAFGDEPHRTATARVEQTLASWRRAHADLDIRTEVRHARPVPALLEVATRHGAQLLVLGRAHRGPVTGHLLSSTIHGALHGAPCPVAVVPLER